MKRIITELKDGKIIPVCELNELDIKAIAVALYHQWHRTVDDDGKAVTCSQEMADTTYAKDSVLAILVRSMQTRAVTSMAANGID